MNVSFRGKYVISPYRKKQSCNFCWNCYNEINEQEVLHMNKKQLEMIRFLSIHNRPMSGKELANALKVTPRSIKNYVHEINGLYGKVSSHLHATAMSCIPIRCPPYWLLLMIKRFRRHRRSAPFISLNSSCCITILD